MKNRLFKCLTCCTVIALSFSNVVAQKRTAQMDSVVSALAREGSFNGNILVAEQGNVIYSKSFGYAEEPARRMLGKESVFELASCSKQFTAAGIVLLQQQGRLSYDDLLSKWIPALGVYEGVTIRHLLQHTSGLPDYMELMDSVWDHRKIATNKDMIDVLAQSHPQPLFAPGTKFEYSNTGYALLASVIEVASGKSYGTFLQENIFKPLKMNNSLVYMRRYAPGKVNNYAYGYIFHDSLNRNLLPDSIPELDRVIWMDGIRGDGMVNSTVGDLLKWDRALYGTVLFTEKSKQLIFSPGILNDGSKTNYGFGWMLKSDSLMGRIANHSGGWPGYVTFIERHMDKDKTIIILQNTNRAQIPAKAIRNILYDQPVSVQRTEVTVPSELIENYVGEYQLAPDFILTVSLDDGQLFAQATGQPRFQLYAESDTRFFLKVVDAQITFEKNAEGKVSGLVLHQGGRNMPASKTK